MLRFHCVVLSELSCDSSTDQGERASFERRIAAGHLRDTVRSQQRKVKKTTTDVSSYSFRLTLVEERLRTQVSTGSTCFA
jgi:hypothetical protein